MIILMHHKWRCFFLFNGIAKNSSFTPNKTLWWWWGCRLQTWLFTSTTILAKFPDKHLECLNWLHFRFQSLKIVCHFCTRLNDIRIVSVTFFKICGETWNSTLFFDVFCVYLLDFPYLIQIYEMNRLSLKVTNITGNVEQSQMDLKLQNLYF